MEIFIKDAAGNTKLVRYDELAAVTEDVLEISLIDLRRNQKVPRRWCKAIDFICNIRTKISPDLLVGLLEKFPILEYENLYSESYRDFVLEYHATESELCKMIMRNSPQFLSSLPAAIGNLYEVIRKDFPEGLRSMYKIVSIDRDVLPLPENPCIQWGYSDLTVEGSGKVLGLDVAKVLKTTEDGVTGSQHFWIPMIRYSGDLQFFSGKMYNNRGYELNRSSEVGELICFDRVLHENRTLNICLAREKILLFDPIGSWWEDFYYDRKGHLPICPYKNLVV